VYHHWSWGEPGEETDCTHHGSLKRGHTALQPVKFTYGGMENASYEYNGRFSFLSVVLAPQVTVSYAHTDAPTTTISFQRKQIKIWQEHNSSQHTHTRALPFPPAITGKHHPPQGNPIESMPYYTPSGENSTLPPPLVKPHHSIFL
jgi:hypothetical protein